MEQLVADDLFLKLVAKRNECIVSLYAACREKVDAFLRTEEGARHATLAQYLQSVAERRDAEAKKKEARAQEAEKRRAEKAGGKKKRKSMIVYIDDMSFCFGKEELEQISGKEKQVDPEVKSVLQQMNELYKQLHKN